jgi:hypothetical protein
VGYTFAVTYHYVLVGKGRRVDSATRSEVIASVHLSSGAISRHRVPLAER